MISAPLQVSLREGLPHQLPRSGSNGSNLFTMVSLVPWNTANGELF